MTQPIQQEIDFFPTYTQMLLDLEPKQISLSETQSANTILWQRNTL